MSGALGMDIHMVRALDTTKYPTRFQYQFDKLGTGHRVYDTHNSGFEWQLDCPHETRLARRWLPYAAIDVHPESMPVQAPAPAPVRLQREYFAPGDSVSFEGRDLIRKFGTIRRINQKTASIACEDGLEWRVSFGLLQRVIPVN